MKVFQVIEAVAALGFLTEESKVAYRDTMLLSLDRAVKTVANEVEAEIGEVRFTHKAAQNCFNADELIGYSGSTLRFFAKGIKSYYFLCDGNGVATINSDAGSEVLELVSSGEFVAYRGFVSGDTEIVFEGEYSYNIKNLAGYQEKCSDDVADIVCYDSYVKYDLQDITKEGEEVRFLSLYEKPIFEGCDRVVRGVLSYTIGSELFIKSKESFVVCVRYKKQPITIDKETDDNFEINLPQRVLFLVPLLTAFYLLRDDEPNMADIYYNDYEQKKNNLILANSSPVARVVAKEEFYADTYLG